ncbi:MAG: pilin [Candidatus Dojkabacteria bacterium]|nr:pilin [Candidatus Dojkabacteria bacterium]MDQ7021308.1 pilin [Candidatus Dojkabacteria bacterium]
MGKTIKQKFLVLSLLLIISLGGLITSSSKVEAQSQDFNFSGNSATSYQCFTLAGDKIPDGVSSMKYNGQFLCKCLAAGISPDVAVVTDYNVTPLANGRCPGTANPTDISPGLSGNYAIQAVLRPPKLQQIEIWFVRIVYIIWGGVAALSFFFLVILGYQYMLTRGDVTKITQIRQRIIYYILGVVLVFLAVPILTTIFRLFGINQQVSCYNEVNMPGFQFFFANLCTDPKGILANSCESLGNSFSESLELLGVPCQTNGESLNCNSQVRIFGIPLNIQYAVTCSENFWQLDFLTRGGP